jgi:hypothetical protein
MLEMKKMLVRFGAAALAALLLSATAHAQPIPWGYGAVSQPDIAATSSPLSSIQLIGSSGNPSGNSGIIIYSLKTSSLNDGVSQAPDFFNNAPFGLTVNLTDIKATGANPSFSNTKVTDVVNFSGLFNATNVTNKSLLPGMTTWSQLPGNASPTEASVVLGSDDPAVGWRKYTVDITSFTSPGQPGGADGAIQAVVTITPASGPTGSGETGGGNPSATPEPASLILAGLGLPLVVLMRRRMKKHANVA